MYKADKVLKRPIEQWVDRGKQKVLWNGQQMQAAGGETQYLKMHSVIFNQKYGQFYFTFGDVIDESILRSFSQTLGLVESILPLDV